MQTKQKIPPYPNPYHPHPHHLPTPDKRQSFIVSSIQNITESLDDKKMILDGKQQLQT